MSKAKVWNQEVLNKARTGEFLKYRQVKSITQCLKNLQSDLLSLVKAKDGEVGEEDTLVSRKLVDDVLSASDLLSNHVSFLDGLLSEYSKKRNKLKLSDREFCVELHKNMSLAIGILEDNNLVPLDRLIFLKELNKVFSHHEFLVVYDLEMTCDEDRESMISETLEMGLVVVNSATFEVVDKFESVVKPHLHPVLTKFIMDLTGIKQVEVDNAQTFDVVSSELREFLKPYQGKAIALQWGEGDMRQITQDSKLHSIDNPFGKIKSYNVKNAYSKLYYRTGSTGLRRASELFGLEREGDAHRALSDALLTLSVVRCMHDDWKPEFKRLVIKNHNEMSKQHKHVTYY